MHVYGQTDKCTRLDRHCCPHGLDRAYGNHVLDPLQGLRDGRKKTSNIQVWGISAGPGMALSVVHVYI